MFAELPFLQGTRSHVGQPYQIVAACWDIDSTCLHTEQDAKRCFSALLLAVPPELADPRFPS